MHAYEQAQQEFEKELSLDPQNSQALAYLGDIEWKHDQAEKAIAYLNRAQKNDATLLIAQLDLGEIYLRQKNYSAAKANLERAVNLNPAEPEAHYQLGRLYHAEGDQAAADKEFRRVQELHTKSQENLVGKISASPPALNPSEER
jgi:Tfp pilus assembly protein PilF